MLNRALERQLDVLRARRDELVVLSPISGTVVTWNAMQKLAARPVRRGQVLLTIAETNGEWELELELAERDVGYVRRHYQSVPRVTVDYALPQEPNSTRSARLIDISPAAQLNADAARTVSARALAADADDNTPGTSVDARIRCGRRALGFIWFRDLIESFDGWN